jgi:2-dehydro-3-deoxyphosphogluconate aldolase/(4S)-4-hydroxy-2-oxoglutarate aldolase
MSNFIARLRESPLVPVITISDAAKAPALAQALAAGGLRHLEVTLRTSAALAAIAAMKAARPDLSIGAGTVLSPADVTACAAAGADFLVTPGSTPALRAALKASGLDVMPGAATLSEVMTLLEDGFDLCKFFPAEQAGGVAALKSFSGPLPGARFCPTGGIGPEKIADYLALPSVVAVGGTWICPAPLIEAGDWAQIEANARIAAGFRKL